MEPFIGQVMLFAGNFAPRGWAFCEGQLMAISSNTALFSILGTTYGGDGRTTFALPDLRGRVPIGPGTGPGLPTYRLGQRGGTANTQLTVLNMPSHNHLASMDSVTGIVPIPVNANSGDEDESDPSKGVLANTGNDNFSSASSSNSFYNGGSVSVQFGGAPTVGLTGGSQPFSNMQPYLAIYYIIALFGTFPSRN
ncbi:tail fiber protein [Roseivirga sp. UBA838]|uniref:phage tail protein n=1 Tax=Roseivirga sp. UBA838 TaxID=1947393 RepID=UPI002579457E|nr:tail fiber protein [Roseivirga sp. UBA838]|tara:strand:- start:4944 stop:5528 length:585 start_codon:yes stop_codon:yes gene_type:complete